jgi:hypothetical protein
MRIAARSVAQRAAASAGEIRACRNEQVGHAALFAVLSN